MHAPPSFLRGLGSLLTPDGVSLPLQLSGLPTAPLRLLAAHGLGTPSPSAKNHTNDVLRELLTPSLDPLGVQAAWYTARGHGASKGWDPHDLSQFAWPELASDFLCVADGLGIKRIIGAGNSMGAATAVCAALQAPERMRAMILYRLPTIWESRAQRQTELIVRAEERRASHPHDYPVLRGAAETNLPPQSDSRWASLCDIPLLILCHGEDEVHPISSGEQLASLLPHARLEVSANRERAEEDFPPLVCSWLREVLSRGDFD